MCTGDELVVHIRSGSVLINDTVMHTLVPEPPVGEMRPVRLRGLPRQVLL